MDSENIDLEFLNAKLNSLEHKIAGFGVDLTENGFILSLLLVRFDEDGLLKEAKASFSFGREMKMESILDFIIGKIKLQRI